MTKTASPKLKTPVGMASYPHLFKAYSGEEGQKAKFSVTLVFDAAAQKTPQFLEMEQAVQDLAKAKRGNEGPSMLISGALRSPFRKDAEAKGYPKGSVFVNLRSDTAPGVVSRFIGPDGRATKITAESQVPGNPDEIYAGSFGRASISIFMYDRSGNRGISFGLNNYQKTEEGKRIDGRRAAQDEFEADLAAEPAGIDDVLGSE